MLSTLTIRDLNFNVPFIKTARASEASKAGQVSQPMRTKQAGAGHCLKVSLEAFLGLVPLCKHT